MAFAQITYRESLRDIEACLGAQPAKLCSMGLRDPVARSTLADANELRDWRLWSDLAAVLIKRARKLYLKDDFGLESPAGSSIIARREHRQGKLVQKSPVPGTRRTVGGTPHPDHIL
jgi:Domain of unknown function (DUF4372)